MKNDMVYLSHILECMGKIEDYAATGKHSFLQSTMIQDAIIRNLEIIGEATKQISLEFRKQNPEIPWKQMAGIRDVLIHDYMGVDLDIIWVVVEKDLVVLKRKLRFHTSTYWFHLHRQREYYH